MGCTACYIRLDHLTQNVSQTNLKLCMWCESSKGYKDAINELDTLFNILINFKEEYSKDWRGANHGKAMIGNIIIGSIKELGDKYSLPYESKLKEILSSFNT